MLTSAPPAARRPPGPRRSFLIPTLFRRGGGPLGQFTSLARDYGDAVSFRMLGAPFVLLNHPNLIREVLVTQARNFTKGPALQRTRVLLGDGLLTSEGNLHRRQRRLIQPTFHQGRIAAFAGIMTTHGERITSGWRHGEIRDLAGEMMRLTLLIVCQTLFGTDIDSRAPRIRAALHTVMHGFPWLMLPFGSVLQYLPLPGLIRIRAARAELDRVILQLIADRAADPADHGDLLSMLLTAQDPESDDPARGMSPAQVRDEVMTLVLAGHETTANALAWTWHLLARHPAAEQTLHAELDRVLPAGRLPTLADLPALAFTEQVVSESLRLYPPAWLIGRRALASCEIGGYEIPALTTVITSQWVTHHDARWFPEPARFNPERWTPEFKATLPKFAFYPFGGGPRRCVAENFAWMELILLVATIARRWRFRSVDAAAVVPEPLITLRPKNGLPMRLEARP